MIEKTKKIREIVGEKEKWKTSNEERKKERKKEKKKELKKKGNKVREKKRKSH